MQSFIDQAITDNEFVLMRVSKSKANTLNICSDAFLRNCQRNISKAYITAVMNKLTCFVSQCRVRTAVKRDGQFCWSFVVNLLHYIGVPKSPKLSKYQAISQSYCKNKKGAFFASQCIFVFFATTCGE